MLRSGTVCSPVHWQVAGSKSWKAGTGQGGSWARVSSTSLLRLVAMVRISLQLTAGYLDPASGRDLVERHYGTSITVWSLEV